MGDAGYGIQTGAAVALSAATAKSILGIKSGSAFGLSVRRCSFAFDGVTASAVPVLCEFCYATFATNAPGTNSTSVTPVQEYGRSMTHGMTAARTWTAEPTVLTVLDEILIHPQSGREYIWPFAQEPDCALGEGFALRLTAPAAVNARASIDVRRI